MTIKQIETAIADGEIQWQHFTVKSVATRKEYVVLNKKED